MRCPLSLSRIHWTEGARTLFYQGKAKNHHPLSLFNHRDGGTLDVFEFIARVIPEARKQNIHFYGAYASRSRSLRVWISETHGCEIRPKTTIALR